MPAWSNDRTEAGKSTHALLLHNAANCRIHSKVATSRSLRKASQVEIADGKCTMACTSVGRQSYRCLDFCAGPCAAVLPTTHGPARHLAVVTGRGIAEELRLALPVTLQCISNPSSGLGTCVRAPFPASLATEEALEGGAPDTFVVTLINSKSAQDRRSKCMLCGRANKRVSTQGHAFAAPRFGPVSMAK